MKKLKRLLTCSTCTTNKKQRPFSYLTGIGDKYTTCTIAIPPKPTGEKNAGKWYWWDRWYRDYINAYTRYKPLHSWLAA